MQCCKRQNLIGHCKLVLRIEGCEIVCDMAGFIVYLPFLNGKKVTQAFFSKKREKCCTTYLEFEVRWRKT